MNIQSLQDLTCWTKPLGLDIFPLGVVWTVIVVLILWSLIWKGLALWKAAREGSKAWFVVLLIVNTVGILEILYLYVFSKKKEPGAVTPQS